MFMSGAMSEWKSVPLGDDRKLFYPSSLPDNERCTADPNFSAFPPEKVTLNDGSGRTLRLFRSRLRNKDLKFEALFKAALEARRLMSNDQLAALNLEKRLSPEFGCWIIYNRLIGTVWSALDFEHELCKIYLGSRKRTPGFSGSRQPDSDSDKAHPVTLGERGSETLYAWRQPITKCFNETRKAFEIGSDAESGWIRAPDNLGNYREGQQALAEKNARTVWPTEEFGFLMSELLSDPERCEEELEEIRQKIETTYQKQIEQQERELEQEKLKKRKRDGVVRKNKRRRVVKRAFLEEEDEESDFEATDDLSDVATEDLSDVHSDSKNEISDSDTEHSDRESVNNDDDMEEDGEDEEQEEADDAMEEDDP